METHVKNQHYVPQLLLRHFSSSDENLIWCYDKTWKKSKERSITNVASENCFYDIIPGQRENSFEYLMGRAESDIAPIILKIIKERSLNILTTDDKVLLALFIALQLNRTKSALREVERINKELLDFVKAGIQSAKVNFEEHSSREVWLSTFYSTPTFANHIMNKLWFLLESEKKFYTSDNPVVMQNILNRKPNRGTLGLNSDGIEIYFPLSPSLLLCLLCERSYDILKDNELPCSAENIENINSLQVVYSDRFIFSSQNNFELVNEMVSKNEI